MESKKVTAIVLAAGSATRMEGTHKLLLPFRGQPILTACVNHLLASAVAEVVVVLGHEHERLAGALPAGARSVINPDYAKGMTSSIQAGVAAAAVDADGYLICLADLPRVDGTTFAPILAAFETLEGPAILVPSFAGKRGHPVLFHAHFKQQIMSLVYPHGCRPLIKHQAFAVVEVPMEAAAVLEDVDTLADYQRLVESENTWDPRAQ